MLNPKRTGKVAAPIRSRLRVRPFLLSRTPLICNIALEEQKHNAILHIRSVGYRMSFWRFADYVTEEHRCPIIEWYGTQEDDVQAEFDLLVKDLSESEDWDEPKPRKRKYKVLTRQHTGLCELKFRVEGRKFRIIGIWLRENREFIFLGGCEKRKTFTIPPDAFDAAFRLKELLDRGKGTTREHV
jgi:hypothetical protein